MGGDLGDANVRFCMCDVLIEGAVAVSVEKKLNLCIFC